MHFARYLVGADFVHFGFSVHALNGRPTLAVHWVLHVVELSRADSRRPASRASADTE
jgi:hypothetical protein